MNTLTIALLTQTIMWLGMLQGFGRDGSYGPSNSENMTSTETVQKTLKMSSGSTILLDTEYGNVTIKGYEGRDVKVELRMEGKGENTSDFRFTHDYFANQVTLKAWYERGTGRQNHGTGKVSFLILIPRDSSYSFQTATRLGNIDAEISANTRSADLSTEMGSVSVKIPYNCGADIDAITHGAGNVEFSPANMVCEPCFKCDINKSDHLKGKIHGGGRAINASAGIGNVYFQVVLCE
ncbi:MAG: hypothetical protein M1395_08825 [Bacteroidetes bacterium]|nr:hypothetical protein [Bacteroidota bacterium]